MNKYTCPCCGYKVFVELPGSYDICPICFWEDDSIQLFYPHSGGANINLIDAQQNYKKYGAIEERFVEHVRKPNADDVKDPKWREFDVSKDELKEFEEDYMERIKNVKDQEPEYYWLK